MLRRPRSRKVIFKVGVSKSLKGCITNNASSLVIDRLSDGSDGGIVSVVYLYCNFEAQKSRATVHMLASLLRQVVGMLEDIPLEIDHAFRKAKQSSGALSLPEIIKLLAVALRSHKRIFICVDALDECGTGHRPDFLRSLYSILRDSPNVRLFATGRPHIQAELEKHHGGAPVAIIIKPVKGDIRIYLEKKLQDDQFPQEIDSELERGIMEEIPEKIEMWVNEIPLSGHGY